MNHPSYKKKCKITHEKVDEYMNIIQNKCEKYISISKKLEKIDNDDFIIPDEKNYSIITKYSYTIKQLKGIAQKYKLKISGIRKELVNRIYIYLRLSSFIIKVSPAFMILFCLIFVVRIVRAFLTNSLSLSFNFLSFTLLIFEENSDVFLSTSSSV